MNPASWIVLILVLAAVSGALYLSFRRRGKCGCCTGDCACCGLKHLKNDGEENRES